MFVSFCHLSFEKGGAKELAEIVGTDKRQSSDALPFIILISIILIVKIHLNLGFKLLLVLVHKSVNSLNRIKKLAKGIVVVKGVDNLRNVLTHIYRYVPISRKDFGRGVGKVGGKYLVDYTRLICLVKLIGTARKETEGRERENSLCSLFL